MERILDENQPREQAGFRKGYSTTDHIHTLNQQNKNGNGPDTSRDYKTIGGHSTDYTLRVTEWQPRNGKRSRGRQARRWRDDIVRTMGNTWTREAKDKEEWRRGAEGIILQWMDGA
ncbi:endonuclease-reverse transcriptase [Elysia marginata]|uniref:Endonuclease-reverse transcriptase n=1 Tax=Elysia marginata TaxID=1093978 RepID=A0AAV4E9B6_9GAST|nr:endonuclease-reverse transcriptase [Elysia marginata]